MAEVQNTLASYGMELITAVKRFMTEALVQAKIHTSGNFNKILSGKKAKSYSTSLGVLVTHFICKD